MVGNFHFSVAARTIVEVDPSLRCALLIARTTNTISTNSTSDLAPGFFVFFFWGGGVVFVFF